MIYLDLKFKLRYYLFSYRHQGKPMRLNHFVVFIVFILLTSHVNASLLIIKNPHVGKTHILIVGSSNDSLSPAGISADIHAMNALFKKKQAVITLLPAPDKKKILAQLKQAQSLKSQDTFIFYYSGSGGDITNEGLIVDNTSNKTSYLLPEEVNNKNLKEKSVSKLEFEAALNQIPARTKIIILDSDTSGFCLPDSITHALNPKAIHMFCAGKNPIILDNGSLFTKAFTEALSGQADIDKNGLVDVYETSVFINQYINKARKAEYFTVSNPLFFHWGKNVSLGRL